MRFDNNTKAFLALVRAGLWEEEARLTEFEEIDFKKIYRLAQEQSVIGLVAAGLEHVKDTKFPKEDVLTIIGDALQLEQRNRAMNHFIGIIVERMREAGIYTLLVKGQGIAQCYERPLWRACGDVDLFLSEGNYNEAKKFLIPLASVVEEERQDTKHLAMTIDEWEIELHGTIKSELWKSIDDVLDDVPKEIFFNGSVRLWLNDGTQVFLPGEGENVAYVFSHILQHLYRGGIGLRQICDWCRLLWTYKDTINTNLLEERLRKMHVMNEWKTFASLAVEYLGMPVEAIPFYFEEKKWKRKAEKVLSFIQETGNFGHNRDYSYIKKYSTVYRKLITMVRQAEDSAKLTLIFPDNALKSFYSFWLSGIKNLLKR